MPSDLRSTRLLGIRIDDVAVPDLLDRMVHAVRTGQRLRVVNANAHLVNLAQTRPWLRTLFEDAEIAFCDGAGVQLALWLRDRHRPHRHTPPQWIHALATRLAASGGTVFWLGGAPGMAEQAGQRLFEQTGLRCVGAHHGFFDPAPGSAGNDSVLATIAAAQPSLLLLNMGMPAQERWLHENGARLQVPVVLTAGALVDHVAGRVRRPPPWVADAGLEWLVRLVIEPRRLWRRYLVGLPTFGLRLLAASVRAPFRPAAR